MNGIVIVDKPQGWTSQDVVSSLRRVFQTKRIGHGGTLDPMATGVLPVFVGRATRAVEFFEHAEKIYEATLLLGLDTDTQDVTGTALAQKPVNVTAEDLEQTLARFRGDIMQVPPMYSALKVDGKKLYELARAGKTVERQPRPITVFALTCLSFDGTRARLRIHCSKGTYIRTLCADIGSALGCGGCMETLRRVQAGAYTEARAVPLETLRSCESPEQYLMAVDTMFSQYEKIMLTANQEKRCRCGNSFSVTIPDGTYRAYGQDGTFLMLAKAENGVICTIKSFFQV